MSPYLLRVLTDIKLDMKGTPRAYTSKTPLEYFSKQLPIVKGWLLSW